MQYGYSLLQSSVMAAKREILQRFQTQAQKQVNIPKEHHRFILGKQGGKLGDLEKVMLTNKFLVF